LFHKIGDDTITKESTYSSSGRKLDDISESGNTVVHENVYIQTKIYEKRLKSGKFNEENF